MFISSFIIFFVYFMVSTQAFPSLNVMLLCRFYTVNSETTFLDNLRQRVVINHPKLIICLQVQLFFSIVFFLMKSVPKFTFILTSGLCLLFPPAG